MLDRVIPRPYLPFTLPILPIADPLRGAKFPVVEPVTDPIRTSSGGGNLPPTRSGSSLVGLEPVPVVAISHLPVPAPPFCFEPDPEVTTHHLPGPVRVI